MAKKTTVKAQPSVKSSLFNVRFATGGVCYGPEVPSCITYVIIDLNKRRLDMGFVENILDFTEGDCEPCTPCSSALQDIFDGPSVKTVSIDILNEKNVKMFTYEFKPVTLKRLPVLCFDSRDVYTSPIEFSATFKFGEYDIIENPDFYEKKPYVKGKKK